MGCCNSPPPSPPPSPNPRGVLAKAASLGLAVVRYAAGGFRPVSQADYEARMAVCDSCPYQSAKNICSACGCYLDVKARMPVENCPHAKWPPLT